jgi:hypothetical protein
VTVGVAAGCAFAVLVVWCVIIHARPLMYVGSGLLSMSIVLAIVMALEVAGLFHYRGSHGDLIKYRGWALKLAHDGLAAFYPPGYGYSGEYPPASIYPLWLSGKIGALLHLSWDRLRLPIEVPQVVLSFLLAVTLFVFLRRSGLSRAKCWIGTMLVALNPALVFDNVVWGQTDALVTLLMFLAAVMVVEDRFELGAALAAAAVMAKPHAILLLPILALWFFSYARPLRWASALASFAAVIAILTAPFQTSHPFDWLPRFYLTSLGYFRETSVNAFNFMALTGGLRQSETGRLMGFTFFQIGMVLTVCVLLLSLYVLWRHRSPAALMLAIFIALFGNFIFAPRMHERYICPALIFLVPAALVEPFLMVLFVAVTLSAWFNLDYALHTLSTMERFADHDPAAMAASALNLILFSAAATYAAAVQPQRLNKAAAEQWPSGFQNASSNYR